MKEYIVEIKMFNRYGNIDKIRFTKMEADSVTAAKTRGIEIATAFGYDKGRCAISVVQALTPS